MNIGDYKYLRVTKKCVAKKLMIVTKYQASSCAVSPSPAFPEMSHLGLLRQLSPFGAVIFGTTIMNKFTGCNSRKSP